jgi:transcriptional regulator with XRE-family HTH domain
VQPTEQFAVNLKRLRAAAGITQMELGDRCDMNFTAISRLERAEREPRLSTIVKLARGLRVPVSALVDGVK